MTGDKKIKINRNYFDIRRGKKYEPKLSKMKMMTKAKKMLMMVTKMMQIKNNISQIKITILVTKKSPMSILIRLDMENRYIIYPNYILILKPKQTHQKKAKQTLPESINFYMNKLLLLTIQHWNFYKSFNLNQKWLILFHVTCQVKKYKSLK